MANRRFPGTRSVKTCSAREDTSKGFGPSNEDHPHRGLGSVPFTLQQIRAQAATFWIPGNGSTYTANCFRPQFGHWSISRITVVSQRSWVQVPYGPEFFFRPYFQYYSSQLWLSIILRTTWAVLKVRPEKKIQARTRFEPMTSAILQWWTPLLK